MKIFCPKHKRKVTARPVQKGLGLFDINDYISPTTTATTVNGISTGLWND